MKSGREYCILREHNGVVDVLDDQDDDPNTITFRTNRFSEYAVAYKAMNVNIMIAVFFAIAIIALVIAAICYYNLITYRRRARRAARAMREE